VAASAFLLAKNTGWTMDYILWHLPVALMHQAEHVYLWEQGAKLRRPGRATGQDRRDIERLLGI
jgi:hypothetical protein